LLNAKNHHLHLVGLGLNKETTVWLLSIFVLITSKNREKKKVRFVLDQHAELDFKSARLTETTVHG
jgi:hypothetical protein